MIRNKQSWDLGDPKFDGQGQLVIHDIVSKLGILEGFTEQQIQIQPAGLEMDIGNKLLGSSSSSPSLTHAVRAGSAESDNSANHSNEMLARQHVYKDDAFDASIISTLDVNTSVHEFQSESSLWYEL